MTPSWAGRRISLVSPFAYERRTWLPSPGAAFALHGNDLRRDLNDLIGEGIKPLRVGASAGADCARLPNIDRWTR